MELLRGTQDRRDVRTIKRFLADLRLRMLPLSENISHRASVYMEEYGLSVAMVAGRIGKHRLRRTCRVDHPR